MVQGTPTWILQGSFGSATVNLTNKALVEHAHRELKIIFKLCGADTAYRSGGDIIPLDDESVLLFNPWVPHAKLGSETGATMIMSLIIEPDWVARLLRDASGPVTTLFPQRREKTSDLVRTYANRLAAAIPHHLTTPAATYEDLIGDLINALVWAYAETGEARDPFATARPIDFRIRRALAYIHEHVRENPKVGEIAKTVGLSRSRFFEQFRRCLGATPQNYIDYVRMALAIRWLSTTDRPLSQLAEVLGFGAQSNFTRFFIQRLAVAPSEFRRQTINLDPGQANDPDRDARSIAPNG
jgi:AraC-like DNA-binding protein